MTVSNRLICRTLPASASPPNRLCDAQRNKLLTAPRPRAFLPSLTYQPFLIKILVSFQLGSLEIS